MIYCKGEKEGAASLGDDPKEASHWLSPFPLRTIPSYSLKFASVPSLLGARGSRQLSMSRAANPCSTNKFTEVPSSSVSLGNSNSLLEIVVREQVDEK